MGVGTYQDCPEGRNIKIWINWIDNFKKCSEAGKCQKICIYNKEEISKWD